MRQMWHSAVAWGYVQHDPFFGIVLPDRGLVQERFLSLDEMQCIIEAAKEPYKTYYWILAETGVRAGEIGALTVSNLLLDHGAIRIAQNVWHGKIQTVKSVKGNRVCEISPQLVEHLRGYLRTWKPNSAGLPIRNQKRHSVGYGRNPQTKTLSTARDVEDRAVWLSRFPSRERNRDGSGECPYGCPARPPRAF